MTNPPEKRIGAGRVFVMSIVPRAPRVSQTEGHRPNLREHPMSNTTTRDNRDIAATTRPAPLVGQLALHPTGTRKPPRRTHGQVRAAVRVSDALLDALGGRDPQPAAEVTYDALGVLLRAWRREADRPPMPVLVDTPHAVALIEQTRRTR